MQLGLIVGIAFAIGAVVFAMQNIAPVTVMLGFWRFDGSVALVLLVALGLGALIAGLISSPAMIRRQWNVAQLGRQVHDLQARLADEARRNDELRAELSRVRGATAAEIEPLPRVEERPYVGLRQLISGSGEVGKPMP